MFDGSTSCIQMKGVMSNSLVIGEFDIQSNSTLALARIYYELRYAHDIETIVC